LIQICIFVIQEFRCALPRTPAKIFPGVPIKEGGFEQLWKRENEREECMIVESWTATRAAYTGYGDEAQQPVKSKKRYTKIKINATHAQNKKNSRHKSRKLFYTPFGD
jgi:hypothetical protein